MVRVPHGDKHDPALAYVGTGDRVTLLGNDIDPAFHEGRCQVDADHPAAWRRSVGVEEEPISVIPDEQVLRIGTAEYRGEVAIVIQPADIDLMTSRETPPGVHQEIPAVVGHDRHEVQVGIIRALEDQHVVVLRRPDAMPIDLAAAILVGRGNGAWRDGVASRYPEIAGRLVCTEATTPGDISLVLQACDLLVQPYPDGVSGRRTSVMAGLANGVAVVTTAGALTEPAWSASGLAVVPTADLVRTALDLLDDPARRAALADAGRRYYEAHFAVGRTLHALLTVDGSAHG